VLLAGARDLGVTVGVELDLVTVGEVRHSAPRRVALDVPLVLGDAQLGRALLELHGIAPGGCGAFDHLLRELERAVVVDANFRDDVDGLAIADGAVSDADDCGVGHCRGAP
jgi:hypothetical protein